MEGQKNSAYFELEKKYSEYEYYCKYALRNISARLDNLYEEMARSTEGYNIIDHYYTRIKTFDSTFDKLARRDLPPTFKSIREELHDVAGARIVTPFKDDVYRMAEMLPYQHSIEIVERRDYIEKPKENGYKSLHIIANMKFHLYEAEHIIPIEIQIRSKGMEMLWSLEHIINYKNSSADPAATESFARIAKILDEFEDAAMELRDTSGIQAATDFMATTNTLVEGMVKAETEKKEKFFSKK